MSAFESIHVGAAGWSYSDWRGVVYPAPRPPNFHEVEYLARYFSVLEINASFYRPLRPELSRVWARKLVDHPNFRFTVKLYQGFTHEGRLDREQTRRFTEGLEPLAETGRLGCLLMQFPWSFKLTDENLRHVARLARAFGSYPLAAEFRHASWNQARALDLLEDHGVAFCNIDQPQLERCLPPTEHVTSSIGYVRLHGRNHERWFGSEEDPGGRSPEARSDYLYAPEQLAKWVDRIASIADRTETTYVIFTNCVRGQAIVNALEILAALRAETIEAPPTLAERYPELTRIARHPPLQRPLFFNAGREAPRHEPRRAAAFPAAVRTAVYAGC